MIEKTLLRQWLKTRAYLTIFDIPKIENFGARFFHNTKPLYHSYEMLLKGGEEFADARSDCPKINRNTDDKLILQSGEKKIIELSCRDMQDLLVGIIDIQEKVLPLGTVVELNKEFVARKIPQILEVDSFRIVITHRFLSYINNVYYPYAGVIYPIGMLGRAEFIHFSYGMINDVVYEGFSDESETEYVIAMKKELVIGRQMHSAGFASQDEFRYLTKILGGHKDE